MRNNPYYVEFQFLMVRLKGFLGSAVNSTIAFQFLMVRLKVSIWITHIVLYESFNSLWYD